MVGWAIAILVVVILVSCYFVGRFLYIIAKRIEEKEQEDFEKRDH